MAKTPNRVKERLLVLEDEEDMARLIGYNLKRAGYQIDVCESADQALAWLAGNVADLAIVDVMLPGMNGLEFCRVVRSDQAMASLPILVLTALGEAEDRVSGLESGADDYLTKPFHPRELQLRVETLLRRRAKGEATGSAELRLDHLWLESRSMRAEVKGEPLQLTRTEFRLLWVLAERCGQILSRESLLTEVWGYERFFDTRTVDTHLRRLRTKLGEYSRWLTTVRGEGYVFRLE